MLTKLELGLVLEALRTARCEIETIEQDFAEYCTTGRLIDQLVQAEALLIREQNLRAKNGPKK